MLHPSEGPCPSLGKVVVMLNVKEKKKEVTQDAKAAAKEHRSDKFEVKIVSLTGDKLAVTSKAGKNYSYRLAKEAKIT